MEFSSKYDLEKIYFRLKAYSEAADSASVRADFFLYHLIAKLGIDFIPLMQDTLTHNDINLDTRKFYFSEAVKLHNHELALWLIDPMHYDLQVKPTEWLYTKLLDDLLRVRKIPEVNKLLSLLPFLSLVIYIDPTIHIAIKLGEIDFVNSLFTNPYLQTESLSSPLKKNWHMVLTAVSENQVELAKDFLACIRPGKYKKNELINCAATAGNLEFIQWLIDPERGDHQCNLNNIIHDTFEKHPRLITLFPKDSLLRKKLTYNAIFPDLIVQGRLLELQDFTVYLQGADNDYQCRLLEIAFKHKQYKIAEWLWVAVVEKDYRKSSFEYLLSSSLLVGDMKAISWLEQRMAWDPLMISVDESGLDLPMVSLEFVLKRLAECLRPDNKLEDKYAATKNIIFLMREFPIIASTAMNTVVVYEGLIAFCKINPNLDPLRLNYSFLDIMKKYIFKDADTFLKLLKAFDRELNVKLLEDILRERNIALVTAILSVPEMRKKLDLVGNADLLKQSLTRVATCISEHGFKDINFVDGLLNNYLKITVEEAELNEKIAAEDKLQLTPKP